MFAQGRRNPRSNSSISLWMLLCGCRNAQPSRDPIQPLSSLWSKYSRKLIPRSLHFAAAKIPAAPVCQHGVVGRGCRMSWEGTVCSWKGRTAACSGLAALSLLCIPVQISSGSQESCLALWVGGSEARPCVVLLTASSVWIGTLNASSPITPGSNSCAYGKQRINPLPEERTW